MPGALQDPPSPPRLVTPLSALPDGTIVLKSIPDLLTLYMHQNAECFFVTATFPLFVDVKHWLRSTYLEIRVTGLRDTVEPAGGPNNHPYETTTRETITQVVKFPYKIKRFKSSTIVDAEEIRWVIVKECREELTLSSLSIE